MVFAYPLAGALYGIWRVLHIWLLEPSPQSGFDFGAFLSVIYIVRMSVMALTTLGFPYRFTDSDETLNLYPIIIPIALILLVRATRVIRFGRGATKTELSA